LKVIKKHKKLYICKNKKYKYIYKLKRKENGRMSEEKSILDMVQGGVTEIINDNVADILLNIQDPNTDGKARELVIKVQFKPADERRKRISVVYNTTKKVRPINPIATTIYAAKDGNGQLSAMELLEQLPGQQAIDGAETPKPVVLNFPKTANSK